jgi:hypothetical protein
MFQVLPHSLEFQRRIVNFLLLDQRYEITRAQVFFVDGNCLAGVTLQLVKHESLVYQTGMCYFDIDLFQTFEESNEVVSVLFFFCLFVFRRLFNKLLEAEFIGFF